MATADTTAKTTTATLPAGGWRVDPAAGEVRFRARGMFGLVPVKGTFDDYEGELEVDDAGARGELRISAASLDTHNARRDTHLRSDDFFGAETHPTLTYRLTSVEAGPDGLVGHGELAIRDSRLPVSSPVAVERHGDRLTLRTALDVDRAEAGVGWSKAGMIKGRAQLAATVVLVRGI